MLLDMTNHLQLAREHATEGEALLVQSEALRPDPLITDENGRIDSAAGRQRIAEDMRARAVAHFTASMAHTNLLLTDPAEFPEPAER